MALVIQADYKTKLVFKIDTDKLFEFLVTTVERNGRVEDEIDIEEARKKIEELEMFIIDKPGTGMGVRRFIIELPQWIRVSRKPIKSSSTSSGA
jgi:hypothetical protein